MRRRKASPVARLRPFWVLFALGLAVAVVVGAFAVFWPGFDPKAVEVTGNHVVPRQAILARAAIDPNRNVWLQSSRAIERRIESIPYVDRARVHRIFPAYVIVQVSERVPFAIVRNADVTALVDRDLRVLDVPAPSSARHLPVFDTSADLDLEPGTFLVERPIVALRDGYQAMIAAHVVPTSVSLDRFGGLVVTVRGNVRILLGDQTDLPRKLALIDPILAQIVRKQQHVAAIDLRAPNTPVLVFSGSSSRRRP